jgi:cysteine desulfurase
MSTSKDSVPPNRIYLDHSATTPVDPRVVASMVPYFSGQFGNASAAHGFGQEASASTERARQQVLHLVNAAHRDEIVFTSGGTESNNLAVKGVAFANEHRGKRILVSKIEHPSVLSCVEWLVTRGFDIVYLDVDRYGTVDVDGLKKALTKDTILVSVMHSNNEIGTIQPISEIGDLCRANGTCFHTDAVQSIGKVEIDVDALNVDLLSISAHKFYGPKGVGALYIRRGTRIEGIQHGGYQEKGRRAGTLNVPGIVGLGVASELAMGTAGESATRLRDILQSELCERVDGVAVNGNPESRLPHVLNMSFRGVESEALILGLDLRGVAVLGGSACSSQAAGISHVLNAIGLEPDLARGSLRFSLGRDTTEDEIHIVLDAVEDVVNRLRSAAPLVHTVKEKTQDQAHGTHTYS